MRQREPEHDPLEPRPGHRRVWSTIGLAIAVLALLYFVGWGISGGRFRGSLARLKAQGEPVMPSDLAPKLKPGERNGADRYEQAFALAPRQGLGQLYANGSWQWNAADLPLARSVVGSNPRYYELLDEASRIPTCSFPAQWDETGMVQTRDQQSELSWALRALEVKLQSQAHDGDLDGALATCGTLLRVTDHVEQMPDLGGRLFASYGQVLARQGLEEVLACGDPSPAACRRIAEQLRGQDFRARLVRSVRVQRVDGLARMRWMERGQWFVQRPPRSARWVVREAYPVVAKPLWNADKERYLEVMDAYLEAAKRPWPEAVKEVVRLDVQTKRLVPPPASPMAWVGMDEQKVFGLTGRDAALAGAWQVALALRAYHHEHGSYPATLAEVERETWKLPLDPFGGKPYHYRRDRSGFTVWSVGTDLKDNGARSCPEDWDALMSPGYDFVVRCAR